MQEAQKKLMSYRSILNYEIDERFDSAICDSLMDRLLEESLNKSGNRLRDGLGYFYNITQGVNSETFPLTTENIRFVNYVFNKFLESVVLKRAGTAEEVAWPILFLASDYASYMKSTKRFLPFVV